MKRALYTSPLPPPPTLACTLTAPTPDDTPKVDGDGRAFSSLHTCVVTPACTPPPPLTPVSSLHASAADSSLHGSGADASRPHHNAFSGSAAIHCSCPHAANAFELNF
jgi:hypothetical protein